MFDTPFHSFILAQTFGLFLLLMAIIMLSKSQYYRFIISRLDSNDPIIPLIASLGLLGGIVLLVVHNIWEWDSEVILTILIWIVFIKSLLWLVIPSMMLDMSKKLYSGMGYYIAGGVMLLLGIFLMAKGFFIYIPGDHFYFTIFH